MSERLDQKFPAERRLRTKAEIDAVFARKWSVAGSSLVMYGLPNHLRYNRLGIVIGRKYGNAVARNRFKRICREAFRLSQCEQRAGWDILVLPYSKIKGKQKQPPAKLILEKVRHELLSSLRRIAERNDNG